jgi:hypothetical protein
LEYRGCEPLEKVIKGRIEKNKKMENDGTFGPFLLYNGSSEGSKPRLRGLNVILDLQI